MFITIKSGLSETTIRLSDIEYCNSSYSYRLQEYDTYLYPVDGLIKGENKLLVREMLVHKESGALEYVEIESLAHLMELIEKEKDYYARKVLK